MRLIGSANPLPVPARTELSTSFSVLELRDYYIPNDKEIILRYVIMPLFTLSLDMQRQPFEKNLYAAVHTLYVASYFCMFVRSIHQKNYG